MLCVKEENIICIEQTVYKQKMDSCQFSEM